MFKHKITVTRLRLRMTARRKNVVAKPERPLKHLRRGEGKTAAAGLR